MDSNAKRLIKSSSGLGLLVVFGYALSFLKESGMAYYFGVSEDVDAYTIAIQIPIVLFSVFSVAIKSVLIPIYSECLYNEDRAESDSFVSNFISIVLLLSFSLAIIGVLFSPLLVSLFAPGFDTYRHDLAASILRISFITLFCTAFCEVVTGVLNVHKKFALPSLGTWIWNIAILLSLVLLSRNIGIYSVVIGNAVGLLLQFLYMFILLSKHIKYRFHVNFKDVRIVDASKKSVPVMLGIGAAEINRIVDRIMASFVGVGGISILNYASKLNTVFASVLDQTVSVVVFPSMSESAAKKQYSYLSSLSNKCLSAYLLILIPMALYIILYNNDIVSIAYGRGSFTADDVSLTGRVLLLLAIGLIFIPMRSILTNLFYSLGDTKTPSYNSIIGIIVNIVLNISLGIVWGINGLAIATSISYFVITILLAYNIRRFKTDISLSYFFKNLYKPIVAGLFLCASFLISDLLISPSVNIWKLVSLFISFIIYCIVLLLLRTDELRIVINKVKYGKISN